ncbi:insecticidal delta-endotoxin Cry8Ea1 family protein [Kitasatospora sp. NPDC059408]|uniref:insecticidal delta-endotoxin Cry8Ea1 family protein n=1 Tax=Kitasatospora sp. NPDC059408 TaxID=3346823 RepID=UPI0036C2AA53
MKRTRRIPLKFVATAVVLSLGSVPLASSYAWAGEPREAQRISAAAAQPTDAMDGKTPTERITQLLTSLDAASRKGDKLEVTDPNQIARYVLAVFAFGVKLVPYGGSALSGMTDFLGKALFPTGKPSVDQLWQKLSDRVGGMIDAKLGDYDAKTLRASLTGIDTNLEDYTKAVNDFAKAPAGKDRDKAAERIRTLHRASLVNVQQQIPQFQKDGYAVAALPLFAAAANVHLALLTDGVKQGAKWGFSPSEIKDMRDRLTSLTTPGGNAGSSAKSTSDKLGALNDAIAKGPSLGVSAKSVDVWREQAQELRSGRQAQPAAANTDYVSYVNKVYAEGRAKVKVPGSRILSRGGPEANEHKTYAEYDTVMNVNVLDYARLWPYLVDKIPDSAKAGLDRELFYGTYGRGNGGNRWDGTNISSAPWDASNPPTVTKRGERITAVRVWGYDDVDAIQIKYGNDWGDKMGGTGGALKELTLAQDEYVTKVEGTYGQKLGKIKFTTNKGSSVETGAARHVDPDTRDRTPETFAVSPDAQELTSVGVTQFSSEKPPGIEGVYLGFRSRLVG